jgi:hypothetical protein
MLYATCRWLPYQVAAFRKYAQGISRIVVAQGPFDTDNDTAISPTTANALGVELLTVPGAMSTIPYGQRFPAIYNYLFNQAPEGELAFACHGDLFPTAEFHVEQLLDGHVTAGRGHLATGIKAYDWTWVACQPAHLQRNRCIQLHMPDDRDAHPWEAYKLQPHALPPAIQSIDELYTEPNTFEWCEPLFLHVDKMRGSNSDPNIVLKTACVDRLFGPCEPLACEVATVNVDGELAAFEPPPPIAFDLKQMHGGQRVLRPQNTVSRYAKAITKWVSAGAPTRTDEEVDEIFETQCKQCPLYSVDRGRCKSCGCNLSGDEAGLKSLLKLFHANALVNKIRMLTEHCPLGRW